MENAFFFVGQELESIGGLEEYNDGYFDHFDHFDQHSKDVARIAVCEYFPIFFDVK